MKKNYLKGFFLKTTLVCLSLAGVLTLNAQTYGPNLVLDPGFEDGGTVWTKSGQIAIETSNIITDTKSARFTGQDYRHVQQIVDVSANSTYKFGFRGRILDAAGPSGGTYTGPKKLVGFVRAGDTNEGEKLIELEIAQGTDITVSGEFSVPEDIHQVFIRIYKNTGICYVDDVLLQLKGDVGVSIDNPSYSFRIIPNGDNSLTIRCNEPLTNIRIINIVGQTILNTSAISNHIALPNNAIRGVYIAEGITKEGVKLLTRFINK